MALGTSDHMYPTCTTNTSQHFSPSFPQPFKEYTNPAQPPAFLQIALNGSEVPIPQAPKFKAY